MNIKQKQWKLDWSIWDCAGKKVFKDKIGFLLSYVFDNSVSSQFIGLN